MPDIDVVSNSVLDDVVLGDSEGMDIELDLWAGIVVDGATVIS